MSRLPHDPQKPTTATRAGSLLVLACLGLSAGSCGGSQWVRGPSTRGADRPTNGEWLEEEPGPEGRGAPRAKEQASRDSAEPFRNTYYDFPKEEGGAKAATVFGADCKAIASVTQIFHDQVCVQGSGRLSTGETISFAKRDCACAAVCPRSGHKICFEKLDPKVFPTGRGATGKPVEPLRSIAVDSDVIPLGSVVFIAEYVGLPLPGGGRHDGCFRADDRGSKVVGRHVDIFTGDPETTKLYNQLVPSNQGVRVELGAARCSKMPGARL